MTIATYEENPCWEDPWEPFDGIEPWEDYDESEWQVPGMCDYCGAEPWRWPNGDPHVDPFGQKICCRECFDQIVGGDDE